MEEAVVQMDEDARALFGRFLRRYVHPSSVAFCLKGALVMGTVPTMCECVVPNVAPGGAPSEAPSQLSSLGVLSHPFRLRCSPP